MALTIEHPAVEQLARELAKRTGESIDEAVVTALRERLERNKKTPGESLRDPVVEEIRERMLRQPRPDPKTVHAAIREIQESLAKLPVLGPGTPDELLGYDEFGLPH
jgi:antitoxin VapB